MKKVLLTLLILVISVSAAAADDIWEPEPPVLNVLTIPDLFPWGESISEVRDLLRDHEFYGMDIGQYEDDQGPVIDYSGRNRYEDFTYSFLFDRDNLKLWQVRTSTVYIDGDSASSVLETVFDFYDMDSMEPYSDPRMEKDADSECEEYRIAADGNTIYCGGYDRYNFSQFGERMFFSFTDRNYYRSREK